MDASVKTNRIIRNLVIGASVVLASACTNDYMHPQVVQPEEVTVVKTVKTHHHHHHHHHHHNGHHKKHHKGHHHTARHAKRSMNQNNSDANVTAAAQTTDSQNMAPAQ